MIITTVLYSPEIFINIRNFGRKSVIEVLDKLRNAGVDIPEDYDFVYDDRIALPSSLYSKREWEEFLKGIGIKE